jgi:hypothetical protein
VKDAQRLPYLGVSIAPLAFPLLKLTFSHRFH